MGDWMNRQLTGIEDAFSGYDEGKLSDEGYTAIADGDSITYFKDGVEVDPPDSIKESFMSGDDEDYSLFGDAGKSSSGFDGKKALEGLSKIGNQTPKAIGKTGRLPGVNMPNVRGGRYSPTQSPYAAPSYLQGSKTYNEQVGRLVNTLLSSKIRGRSIKSLI